MMTEEEAFEAYHKCMICCRVLDTPSRTQLRRCVGCWANLDKVFVQYTAIPVEEWDRNAAQ